MDLHSPDRVTVPMLRRGAGGVQGGTWRWGVMSRCTGLSTSTEASAPARDEVHHPKTSKRGDVPSDAKASPLPLSVTGHCGGTTGSVAAQKCAVCFIFSAPLLEGLTEVGRIRGARAQGVFAVWAHCFDARMGVLARVSARYTRVHRLFVVSDGMKSARSDFFVGKGGAVCWRK